MLKLLAFVSWLVLSLILLHIAIVSQYSYECPDDYVVAIHFWPDSDHVLITYTGSYAQLWAVGSEPQLVHTFRFPYKTHTLSSFAVSPDGRQFLTASWNDQLILWDSTSGNMLREFDHEYNEVMNIAFTPDGSGILAVTDNWYTYHWDIQTGKPLDKYSLATDLGLDLLSPIRSPKPDVVVSPNSKHLLKQHNGRYVALLDSATRTQHQILCPPVLNRSLTSLSLYALLGLLISGAVYTVKT